MTGGVDTTVIAAFAVGFISFISPCVLPLVPGYLSAVSGYTLADMKSGDRGLARILLGTAVAGPLIGRATGKKVGVLVVPQSRTGLEAVLALVAQGAVTPRIDKVYPLRDASAAFARLAAGESLGKLVLEVSED